MSDSERDGDANDPSGKRNQNRIEVGLASDLPPGERTIVEANGRSIGVFNVDGEYHALLNHCLHRGGPVCEGQIQKEVVAEWPGPGRRTDERLDDNPTIACPWHGWEFDIDTGVHIGDSDYTLPTYDVTVEDGTVYVEL